MKRIIRIKLEPPYLILTDAVTDTTYAKTGFGITGSHGTIQLPVQPKFLQIFAVLRVTILPATHVVFGVLKTLSPDQRRPITSVNTLTTS